MLEWAGIGAIMFALVIFCARIMRRGLSTLDDDRERRWRLIAEDRRKIEEDNKNISAAEQLRLAEAAIRDLLRLNGSDYDCEVVGHTIGLHTRDGDLRVELLMRERSLRSRHKVLHGRSRWLLHTPGGEREYTDLAQLMAGLSRNLRGEMEMDATPGHLALRLAGSRSERRSRRR